MQITFVSIIPSSKDRPAAGTVTVQAEASDAWVSVALPEDLVERILDNLHGHAAATLVGILK